MGNIVTHRVGADLDLHQPSSLSNSNPYSVGNPNSNSPLNFSNPKTSSPAGLSIILNETNPFEESKNIVFSPRLIIMSFPKFNSIPRKPGSGTVVPTTAEEITLSEEYTCVITLTGPNPKMKHFFGDTILECHPVLNMLNPNSAGDKKTESFGEFSLQIGSSYRSELDPYFANRFLKKCFICKKDHQERNDIFMYSEECRSGEIFADYYLAKGTLRRTASWMNKGWSK